MILTRLTSIPKSLSAIINRSFSSSGHHHEKAADEEEVEITKFNPNGELDLRGHENMKELNDYQLSYSPILSKKYHHFSAYHFFSLFGNKLTKAIGSIAAQPLVYTASDQLNAPRIHPNGIPIYDCCNTSSRYLTTNKLVTIISPINIALFTPYPALSVLSYGLLYYVYYVTHLELAKNLVLKMELVPNTEEIIYQTTSIFGSITTKRVKISDLIATDFDELFGQKNVSERATRGLYNKEVAFRIKGSKDLLLFSKNGFWNKEGLNHELIC